MLLRLLSQRKLALRHDCKGSSCVKAPLCKGSSYVKAPLCKGSRNKLLLQGGALYKYFYR